MTVLNCATSTLAPYVPDSSRPWNRRRAAHLFRRMGFGAPLPQIEAALNQAPLDVVNALLDQALNAPPIPQPAWAYWTDPDYSNYNEQTVEHYYEWSQAWVNDAVANPLRAKLTLFWSNHFVTKYFDYFCSSSLYQYYRVLEQYALGNFKDFVYQIGITPAMLVFLNGAQNSKFEPNENYARELYELFTLGADNGYTQQDIEETARALTGWTNWNGVFCGPKSFNINDHDTGVKTIFGRSGNWGYDDVIDILFEERADLIAEFICRKIYTHFVHPEPDESIVQGLANTFKANNFELEPVFRQLFRSEHFFDEAVIGVQIKSPLDYAVGMFVEAGAPLTPDSSLGIVYVAQGLDQFPFDPVNVAGWPGNRAWISSSALASRWQAMDYFTYLMHMADENQLRSLAQTLAGDPDANDPILVATSFVDHFLPLSDIAPEIYERAIITFKADIPPNYYDEGLWNLHWETIPWQVSLLLSFLAKVPEMQMA